MDHVQNAKATSGPAEATSSPTEAYTWKNSWASNDIIYVW